MIWLIRWGDLEAEDDDFTGLGDFMIGGKVQVSLADMDLPSWEHDLKTDLLIITDLLTEMKKVSPSLKIIALLLTG
jgi:hypothetical protein